MWVITVMGQGFGYLTAYPQYLLSFVLTVFGLLTIALFTVYFAKKSIGSYDVNQIGYRTVGGILLALGVYFLWNYLTWIYFGGWNEWYAWFLGHNLDLWLLSLPLVGLPLLFHDKNRQS
jgi:hypothetical protein